MSDSLDPFTRRTFQHLHVHREINRLRDLLFSLSRNEGYVEGKEKKKMQRDKFTNIRDKVNYSY